MLNLGGALRQLHRHVPWPSATWLPSVLAAPAAWLTVCAPCPTAACKLAWPTVCAHCALTACARCARCRSMLRGKMEHADSMGNKGVIGDGELRLPSCAFVCRLCPAQHSVACSGWQLCMATC